MLLVLALAAAPALITFLSSLLLQAGAYVRYHDLATVDAMWMVVEDTGRAYKASGLTGAVLLAINHVGSFGVIAAVSIIALRWCGPRRIACFYLVSTVILITIAFKSTQPIPLRPSQTIAIVSDLATRPDFWWLEYWISYPNFALPLAVATGLAIASLPLFGESPLASLIRGRCPKCSYDLQRETSTGCPECGWNRLGPHAGREEPRMIERSVLLRKRTWLISGWTIIMAVAMAANVPLFRSAIPRVIDIEQTFYLYDPHSEAYSAVEIELLIRSVSGWFEYPGEITHTRLMASLLSDDLPLNQRLSYFADRDPKQEAQDTRTTISSIEADVLAKEVRFDSDGDVEIGDLDATTLSRWLETAFSDADPVLLSGEGVAILDAVEYEMRQCGSGRRMTPPQVPLRLPAFRGAGGGYNIWTTRLWYPGVAIVAGVVLAVWLYGAWVILRWTKTKA